MVVVVGNRERERDDGDRIGKEWLVAGLKQRESDEETSVVRSPQGIFITVCIWSFILSDVELCFT